MPRIEACSGDLQHPEDLKPQPVDLLSGGLLQCWPTLALLKRTHVRTLRAFLKEHGFGNEEQQTEFIQPVRRQSGKSRHVSCRYACSKFLRQTFDEFADAEGTNSTATRRRTLA